MRRINKGERLVLRLFSDTHFAKAFTKVLERKSNNNLLKELMKICETKRTDNN